MFQLPLKSFFLIAALALQTSANAEISSKKSTAKTIASTPALTPAPAPCLLPKEVESKHLIGTWRITQPQHPETSALLTLERHPEHEDSLRGTLRPSQGDQTLTVWLVGDIDEGELVMDESLDGRTISAIWVVQPVAESCGRLLKGERRAADDERTETLVMRYEGQPTLPAKPAHPTLPKVPTSGDKKHRPAS